MCELVTGRDFGTATCGALVTAAGGELVCLSILTLKACRVGRLTACTMAYCGGLGASLGGCLELVFIGEGLV